MESNKEETAIQQSKSPPVTRVGRGRESEWA